MTKSPKVFERECPEFCTDCGRRWPIFGGVINKCILCAREDYVRDVVRELYVAYADNLDTARWALKELQGREER